MLPSTSTGFAIKSPALIKDFENKRYQKFSITPKYEPPLVINSMGLLKKEQLIAGMAFQFFGLHNMPIYKANTAFLNEVRSAELPIEATELLDRLQDNIDVVRDGQIYCNSISKYKSDLPLDLTHKYILSYSIATPLKEVILVYNTSLSDVFEKFILLNRPQLNDSNFLEVIYGYDTSSYIQVFHSLFDEIQRSYIRLYLKPMQLVILQKQRGNNIQKSV